MTGYVMLVQDLWNAGRYDEVERWIAEATSYASERDLLVYLDHVTAYRFRLQSVRGEWDAAEDGLRRLLRTDESGTVRQCLPELSRLLVRRGADDAQEILTRALDFARRADSRYALVPAAMASIELAWLTGRPEDADDAVDFWPRAPRFRAPNGRGPTSCAGSAGLADRPAPSRAARPSTRRAWRATGRRRRPPSPGRALATSRPSSSPTPAKPSRCSTRCACSTSWAHGPRRPCSADASATGASPRCRGDPRRRPGRTRPASPTARSRSCGCWPRPDQRGDRGDARAVRADGRPPRVRRAAEARGHLPPRGGRGRRSARAQLNHRTDRSSALVHSVEWMLLLSVVRRSGNWPDSLPNGCRSTDGAHVG